MALRPAIGFTPVSVRLLGLADGCAGRAADGRADRSGYESPGDGASGGLLFNGLATCGDACGGQGRSEDQDDTFHGGLLWVQPERQLGQGVPANGSQAASKA
jgi:hypothetical protein